MKILLILCIFVSGFGILVIPNATAQIQIDPASIYYNDSGSYVPYKLIDNSTALKVLTKDGSYILDKNSCSLVFHNDTNTNSSPTLKSDSWSVLASLGNSGVWNPVSIINNAACTTSVAENQGSITINATRSVSGAGSFTTQYVKKPQTSLELILHAINNNPSWTNYHIGGEEKIGVSRFISFGNQTYDLAQYNNTVLSRSWIQNHNAQFIQLASNVQFNLGNAWPYVSQIKIQNTNGNYYLVIDYTYNTPILSPGNTITVDPSIDTKTSDGTVKTAYGTTAATQTYSFTVGTGNSNRMLIVGVSMVQNINAPSTDPVSVTYNGVSMTSGYRKSVYNLGSNSQTITSEFFYLANPSTGANNIVITLTSTNTYSMASGAYSLYNVKQTSPIGATATNSGTGGGTLSTSITPATPGSMIMDMWAASGSSAGAFSSPNKSSAFKSSESSPNNYASASQYDLSPTIGSSNTLSWSSSGSTVQWVGSSIEVKNTQGPTTPTISKVNTINSTAINATFNKPTGATFTLLNITLSGGATTHINTTATQLVLNNYTAGSKYTFQAFAGNSSGISSGSVTKYNYTTNIAPTSLVFSSITKNSARVSWTNPSGNFSGFKIEYSANGGTSYVTATSNTNNSTNHYDLTSLLSNVLYTVRASTNYGTGSNYSGTSNPSTTNTFTTLPTAPTSVKANTASTSQTNLSWTAPTGNGTITGYKVEISPNNSTFSTVTSNTGNSTTVYSVTGLPSNVQDYFRISAINAGGTSIVSNVPKNTTLASTSSSLLTSSITTTSMHLSWTAPTGNATITGYKVQYSANGGISYVIANTNTGNSTTHYDFTGLSPNVLYTLQISAINAGGTGTGTTTTQVTVPNAPTGLLISSVKTTGMRLSWTDTGNGTITGHKLEYSANSGASYVTASANTGNSTSHYDFTGLSANILYTLRVSTINAAGTSVTTTTTQTTIPNAPSALVFSGTTNSSTILSWTGTSGGNATITGYEIDKSTDNGLTYSTVTSSTGNTTTSYTVTGLSSSTLYYFKIEAINAGGTSASLTPASVTTLSPTPTATISTPVTGGSGIGGPVTPLQITPVLPAISQGITFTASNDVIIPNQIKNETVTISWPSSETLNVNSIQFGATALQTKLVNIPPYGLTANKYGISSGIIEYVIQVPRQCDQTTTTNCIDVTNPILNLPISFDVTLNGTETTQTVTPQFSVQQQVQLPLSLIIIGVSFVAAGYLIIRYKLRTSKLNPKKHFKTGKVKEPRLEKPKKKR